MSLATVGALVFLINLPFGAWRARLKKMSFWWFFAIHATIPGVIALRLFGGLGWQLKSFFVLVSAYFLGQLLGSRLPLPRFCQDIRNDK